MVTKNVEQVLNGIKALNISEKKELAKLLSGEFLEGTKTLQINESLVKANTIHTAPIGGSGCVCCGK